MKESYVRARAAVGKLLAQKPTSDEALAGVVEILQSTVPHYAWVGIYLVEGNDLVLRAWKGPEATEHIRIPIGQGVCGWAAEKGETVVVDDVSKDRRYLMCFPDTKSEIVVPIASGGKVCGEIDIDGDELAAFGGEDARFLGEIASLMAAYTC